ncbi:importin subunit alpha-like [Gossypium raimondii]|uniref:importin subunit alpha-like n=1 Tax=Gossypium raimondii TaxID=29730 RepID=UPI00227B089B|nr:importin subunit alpha-like [Gossypium raimondii]
MVLPSLVIRARYECSSCDFNLDLKCASSVCSDKRPRTLSHSLHPKHPRRLTFAINIDKCNVCSENRDYSGPVYSLFRLIIHRHQMYVVNEELKGENYCRGCRLLEILVANVWSDNSSLQLQATTRFTELLSIYLLPFITECRAPIEEVIQAGVVPRFVELLDSLSDSVREQAVLALGNITGDSLRCRDLVLGHGALLPLLALFNKPVSISTLRNATWTLSKFCEAPFDQAKLVLPTLARLIHSNDDEEVLTDACWALSYLSDGTNDKIQAVTEAGVCGRLVKLLIHPSPSVITPALYMVRNIVSGDDVQTQCVMSHQALPCLVNLLTNNYEKRIKNVACWTISNITAGNEEQIQVVIEPNIITPWVHLLQNAEFDIKKQAAWGVGHKKCNIWFLVSQGCIKPLCDLLSCPDPEVVTVCLQGLENILKVGEVDKKYGHYGRSESLCTNER